jgi:hypothetical protein
MKTYQVIVETFDSRYGADHPLFEDGGGDLRIRLGDGYVTGIVRSARPTEQRLRDERNGVRMGKRDCRRASRIERLNEVVDPKLNRSAGREPLSRVEVPSVLSVIVVSPAAAEADVTSALLGFRLIQLNCPVD